MRQRGVWRRLVPQGRTEGELTSSGRISEQETIRSFQERLTTVDGYAIINLALNNPAHISLVSHRKPKW
jgi:hypothetical protein